MAYVEKLSESGIEQCLYHSFPECDPNIFWVDETGVLNWMILRTMKESDDIPSMPKEVIERLKRIKGKGHYALVTLSNPNTKGILLRGEAVDIRMEIEDI